MKPLSPNRSLSFAVKKHDQTSILRSLVTKDVQRSCQYRSISTMKITTSSFDNRNMLNFKQKHRKTGESILSEQEPITRLLNRDVW